MKKKEALTGAEAENQVWISGYSSSSSDSSSSSSSKDSSKLLLCFGVNRGSAETSRRGENSRLGWVCGVIIKECAELNESGKNKRVMNLSILEWMSEFIEGG